MRKPAAIPAPPFTGFRPATLAFLRALAANQERCVTLPMLHPEVRSLNLATSVGIGLYEALRQTGFSKR